MIIATAGHVDHGKTSLLKRLTGVDADRLPEEKKRGLTIDLGFAYSDSLRPGETTGFVDVPGHEKFIHNMLAGVTAIDAALLVVAADDGPMPQTREHLAILDLVGVHTGIVAVTKTDMVEPERVNTVVAEIRELLSGTTLAASPILPLSSVSGDGIEPLRKTIAAIQKTDPATTGGFRMAIDRSFVIDGAGLVVTGLVQSGKVAVGETLAVSPAGQDGIEARVRGLRVQDEPADLAQAGDRCAVNLSGSAVDKSAIGRGQWLVVPEGRDTSRRLDIELRLLATEEKRLRHWTPVHVHVGTADIPGRIALLEERKLMPGDSALAQLVLDQPVCVSHGEIAIVRDQSARRTIGGGPILDHAGPHRGRARPSRLAQLKAQRRADPEETMIALLEKSPEGVDLAAFARNRNLAPNAVSLLRPSGSIVGKQFAVLEHDFNQIATGVVAVLSELGGPNGQEAVPVRALAGMLPRRPLLPVLDAVVETLVGEGRLERKGRAVRLKGDSRSLTGNDADLWPIVEKALMLDGRPQTIWEVSESVGVAPNEIAQFLKRAREVGLVVQASKNRFLTPASLTELAAKAEEGLAGLPGDRFTVANFRDWSGLGRNLSVEMLEFFDRAGFTRRAGNERVIRIPSSDAFPPGSP